MAASPRSGDPDSFLAPPWTAGVTRAGPGSRGASSTGRAASTARWSCIGHTPPAKHRTFSGMADPHVLAHDRLSLDGGSALTGLVVAAEIQDGRYRLLKARR